jgi:hypothetical protein
VDEQVGITMTHLAYCWDGGKQMQIVVAVVRIQGMLSRPPRGTKIKTSLSSKDCFVFVVYEGCV